jgi:putative tricarboxylic transport membrane protein
VTAPEDSQAPPDPVARAGRFRVPARVVFLAVLLLLFAGYTQLAMGMEWRTTAGRIGPGFFPRIVGVAGIALCCAAIARALRAGDRREEPEHRAAGSALGRHPRLLAAACAALAAYLVLFVPLGAVLTAALFIFAASRVLGRRPVLADLALSLLVPAALYLLFEVGLGTALPEGVLPLP